MAKAAGKLCLPSTAALCAGLVLLAATAIAQPNDGASPSARTTIVDAADRTGTNPASVRDTLEVSNAFRSLGDGLFVDDAKWHYAHAFAQHRLRARVDLPLSFANVTGRTEAGLGDLGVGLEWIAVVGARTAWIAGADATVDTSTNDALTIGHNTVAPSVAVVLALQRHTLASLSYRHHVSLGSADDRPDIAEGTLEAALVRRFADDTWLRALPTAVFDVEGDTTHLRLDAEWGRVLAAGASTWVRAGRAFGASDERPFDWSLVIGFRFVR